MKVLGLIPAGGGSKSSVLRNLRLLGGKPLLAYTAETALAAARLSRVVLSTGDKDVAETGRRCGLESLPLARETTSTQGIAQDAVRRLEEAGESFDAVCILDPLSPFGQPEDVDRCIELLERSGADSAATVVPVPREYHPHTVYLQAPDGSLRLSAGTAAGEELLPAFSRDGSVCVVRHDVLMNGHGLLGERTAGYVVDPVRLVRLDRPEDWGRAEHIARLGAHRATTGRIVPLAGPRLNLAAGWVPTPIADPRVCAGVSPLKEGALGSTGVTQGAYLEPVRRAAQPRYRESETPFVIREALLLAERESVAHGFLGATPPALVVNRPRSGGAPSVSRIEDPFRAHPKLLPGIQTTEVPLMAALSARLLGGSGLERALEPSRREIGGGSQVRPAAAPIQLTAPLKKGAGRLQPEQPFALMSGQPWAAPKGRMRSLPMQQLPPALVPIRIAQPLEPASGDLWAREELAYTPACRREGRLLAQTASPESTRVEVLNTHPAKLAGASHLVFKNPLATVPPTVVRSRTRQRAAEWLAEGGQLFGRESAVIVFASIQARAHGVEWPTVKTFLFVHPPERPAKAGLLAKIDPRETEAFLVRAASLPASPGLETRMPGAPVTKLPAQSIRAGSRTLTGAVLLAGGFRGSGEPVRRPSYQALLKIALMPGGVFHYIEIEDHEDYATWTRAPHYPAALLMPDSGCDVRSHARLAATGYSPVLAEPHAGPASWCRVIGELTSLHEVAVGDSRTGILEMDFATIAESGSTRWPFSFKKSAGFFG
jgi:CMP-N,N'-diacetyllegionaminic acid synthase